MQMLSITSFFRPPSNNIFHHQLNNQPNFYKYFNIIKVSVENSDIVNARINIIGVSVT